MELNSILDVPMQCERCGKITKAGDCEGDVDGDGSLGCPVEDCGGICTETPLDSQHHLNATRNRKRAPK